MTYIHRLHSWLLVCLTWQNSTINKFDNHEAQTRHSYSHISTHQSNSCCTWMNDPETRFHTYRYLEQQWGLAWFKSHVAEHTVALSISFKPSHIKTHELTHIMYRDKKLLWTLWTINVFKLTQNLAKLSSEQKRLKWWEGLKSP